MKDNNDKKSPFNEAEVSSRNPGLLFIYHLICRLMIGTGGHTTWTFLCLWRSWKPILLLSNSSPVQSSPVQLLVSGGWSDCGDCGDCGAAGRRNSALLTVLREDCPTHCKLVVPELCTTPSQHNTHKRFPSYLTSRTTIMLSSFFTTTSSALSSQFRIYILFSKLRNSWRQQGSAGTQGGAEGDWWGDVRSVGRWRWEMSPRSSQSW